MGREHTSIGYLPKAIFGSPTSLMLVCLIHPHPQPSRVSTAAHSWIAVKHIFVFSSPCCSHLRDNPDCKFSSNPVVRVYGGDKAESRTRLNRLLPKTPPESHRDHHGRPFQRHIITNDASSISNPLPSLQRQPLREGELPVTLLAFEREKGPKALSRFPALACFHSPTAAVEA